MVKNNKFELLKKIYGHNIYGSFNEKKYPLDLQGWGECKDILNYIEKKKPKVIVEVGTWKGNSALKMAELLKKQGTDGDYGIVICVDTWLGSDEHWERKYKQRWESLTHINGYPSIYYQFLANVKKLELEKFIVPIPNTSSMAARLLKKHNIKADLIYIDGSHHFDEVSADLDNYYFKILKKGGILFGDDYVNQFPGVKDAVDNFVSNNNLKLNNNDGLYHIKKIQD